MDQNAEAVPVPEPSHGGGASAGSALSARSTLRGAVDWDLALSTAKRLAPTGPRTNPSEVRQLVAQLRVAARASRDLVARTTGLQADAPGTEAPEALVVDRAQWATANVRSARSLMDPMLARALERARTKRGRHTEDRSTSRVEDAASGASRRIAGLEVGGLLGFVSGKVLGQYDLAPDGTPALLLVAPNILAVERELQVDPTDFRRWVCLHEETHRVQFTAIPWLRDHLVTSVRTLGDGLVDSGDDLAERFATLARSIPQVIRGEVDPSTALATPEQREQIARVTAVMSLLEGHADVVMDEAAPGFVRSVERIRTRFDERRAGAGGLDRLLRRLLGLESKMRQYSEGAAFVRGVREQVGRSGFDAVWAGPENLPLPAEITDPTAWVARVHG